MRAAVFREVGKPLAIEDLTGLKVQIIEVQGATVELAIRGVRFDGAEIDRSVSIDYRRPPRGLFQ